MLEVEDLINIQYIPKISEISLPLLVDFYEQYLCKRFFIFELEDGRKVKLFFKDASEILHISGVDHIYENMHMDGTRFVEGIQNNTIDFDMLENINRAAYTDYINRIRSVACIDTIIKNCEYLWFADGKIPGSRIKVKYLLLKGLDGKNIHLGIDTYKEGRPYYSKTLLVTEGNSSSKYIDKVDSRLRVCTIDIVDKNSNDIMERIDRRAAIEKADEVILELANNWSENMLSELISEYHETYGNRVPNSRKKKEWISKLSRYLEGNQEYIRNEVKTYDPYWTSKIVAEQTRAFAKQQAIKLINEKLEDAII